MFLQHSLLHQWLHIVLHGSFIEGVSFSYPTLWMEDENLPSLLNRQLQAFLEVQNKVFSKFIEVISSNIVYPRELVYFIARGRGLEETCCSKESPESYQ